MRKHPRTFLHQKSWEFQNIKSLQSNQSKNISGNIYYETTQNMYKAQLMIVLFGINNTDFCIAELGYKGLILSVAADHKMWTSRV